MKFEQRPITTLKVEFVTEGFASDYLCDQSLTTVSLHSHSEVQPGPGVVMILQTGQNQVQILPVNTALLSLQIHHKRNACECNEYEQHTLTCHFIRYTLLVPGWTPFCLQNCLNSSWHIFNKLLEIFLRDFGPY